MNNLSVEHIDNEKKFEILKIELQLLQTRFDKYDNIFFINRNWAVTIIVALVGAFFTTGNENPNLLVLATIVGVFFWIVELTWRTGYMDKYKFRYKYLCKMLNDPEKAQGEIKSVYDFTNFYGVEEKEKYPIGKYFLKNLIRGELLFFYTFLSFSPWIAYCLGLS